MEIKIQRERENVYGDELEPFTITIKTREDGETVDIKTNDYEGVVNIDEMIRALQACKLNRLMSTSNH